MGLDTIPTGIPTAQTGSLVAPPQVIAVAALTSVVLGPLLSTPAVDSGPGIYALTSMGANVRYEVFDGTVWQIIVAVGGIAPFIYSDGVNFRFTNIGGVNQTATVQKIG